MSDLIRFEYDDVTKFAQRMKDAPVLVGTEMTRSVDELTLYGQREAMSKAPWRTGHLRHSIAYAPATFAGGVASGKFGTTVPYAAQREYGGPIVPKNKKSLRFTIGGKTIFTKRVVQKGTPYMRPARDAVGAKMPGAFRAMMRRIVAKLGDG